MSQTPGETSDLSAGPAEVAQAFQSPQRKRKILLLSVAAFLIAVVGGFFGWYQLNRGAFVYAVLDVRLDSGDEANRDSIRQKRVTQIKSWQVLGHALHQPQVAELETVRRQDNPLDWLASNLHVDLGPTLTIVELSIRGSNAPELVTVLDAVIDAYVKEMGSDDPQATAQKIKERKEMAEMMEARMPPAMKAKMKHMLHSELAAAETPRVRVLQKATAWK
ncbi:MAG TPA: hypothetical protein VG099_31635 [Gemmataceae bacterium]|nr:hypothetical protein [Gemmataceae bacterium]